MISSDSLVRRGFADPYLPVNHSIGTDLISRPKFYNIIQHRLSAGIVRSFLSPSRTTVALGAFNTLNLSSTFLERTNNTNQSYR